MRKIATKRLRAPVGQSQACVFSVAASVPTLVSGNMRCVALRYNAQRTTLSVFNVNGSTVRWSGFLGWGYFVRMGRTANFGFSVDSNITLVVPTVKIREKMHTFGWQGTNGFPSFTNVSEAMIARF
jgi:hypothetical protein